MIGFGSNLSNHSQRVVVGGQKSSPKLLSAGVPQGSILGLLFLIFINDVMTDLQTRIPQYADDMQLGNWSTLPISISPQPSRPNVRKYPMIRMG